MDSTILTASLFAAGKAAGTGAVSIKVTTLTEGVMKAMLFTKLKAAIAVALILGFVAAILTGHTAAVQPDRPPVGEKPVRVKVLGERSLEQRVADAQVIVVATALDSAPAPPKRPGDLPESLIRFKVRRVLKGNLADKVITTRTPTAAAEFIGKDWVIMLSPEYMARKHQFADCNWIKAEPEVKGILTKDAK